MRWPSGVAPSSIEPGSPFAVSKRATEPRRPLVSIAKIRKLDLQSGGCLDHNSAAWRAATVEGGPLAGARGFHLAERDDYTGVSLTLYLAALKLAYLAGLRRNRQESGIRCQESEVSLR